MSFILDALKKSENDRQRQSGPALFEVRVAPPKSRFPSWAIALVGLLVINLAVIGWLMFRKPAAVIAAPALNAATAPTAPAVPAPSPAPPPAQMATSPAPPPPAYLPPTQAQATQQQQTPPPAQEPNPTLQEPQHAYVPEDRFNNSTANAANIPVDENPDDYAPAAEPSSDEERPLGRVRRGLANGLMTYEEAATKNQIPPLRMDLHVYAPDPRRRFVLVNMKRLLEGESLPEGVKVESITTDGAILSYRGVQFVMERD